MKFVKGPAYNHPSHYAVIIFKNGTQIALFLDGGMLVINERNARLFDSVSAIEIARMRKDGTLDKLKNLIHKHEALDNFKNLIHKHEALDKFIEKIEKL